MLVRVLWGLALVWTGQAMASQQQATDRTGILKTPTVQSTLPRQVRVAELPAELAKRHGILKTADQQQEAEGVESRSQDILEIDTPSLDDLPRSEPSPEQEGYFEQAVPLNDGQAFAEGIEINDAVSIAINNDPEFRRIHWQIEQAKGQGFQATRLPNPSVGISGEEISNDGAGGLYGIFYSQSVVRNNRLEIQQKFFSDEVALLETKYDIRRWQIAKDVATRFLTVRRAEQQQRVLKQQIESLLEFQETTEKLFEAGEISKIGLNNIELELVTQQQMVREQQLQIDFELRALATQIGLDDPSSLSLQNQFAWQESIDQLMLHATDDGLNEWLAVHPQLTLARSLAAQSRWQIELAKQGRTPDVQVQGSLGIDTATDSIFAGFQVGVPILKYDDKRGQVSAAHAKYHDLLEYVRANERQLSINYVESAGTIARLKSRITNIRELRVPKAMENLEQIRSAYQIGEANFLTLKNGLDTVIQARMAQLAAEFELSVATIRQETFLLDEQLR